MIGFGIDEIQANYVAEIKLRNINKEYILKRPGAIDDLEGEIADLKDTLNSPRKLKNVIIKELQAVAEKFGQPRRHGDPLRRTGDRAPRKKTTCRTTPSRCSSPRRAT